MKERKLDLFQGLRAADNNDGDWLSRQPEDARKEFVPLNAMRYAATVSDGLESAYMLMMVNERVNHHLFSLSRHPDLIFRLIASCGLGAPQRHHWIAGPTRKAGGDVVTKLLISVYPDASDAEINLLLSLFDRASFKRFVDECGIQTDEAKEVMKVYDKTFNNPEQQQHQQQQKKIQQSKGKA